MGLNQYRIISFDRQMGVGVAGAMQVTIPAVAKTDSLNAPYCLANELICAELARFIRLPVPPCGILRPALPTLPPYFASLDFNFTGNSLPPVDVARCYLELPQLSTGLLLFDILVANCDRHRANFAVDFGAAPPRMSVFDHSHALLGYTPGGGTARLRELRSTLGCSGALPTGANRHCLLDTISADNYFDEWIDRIQSLPDYLIAGLCQDAADIGLAAAEGTATLDFLKYRRDRIRTIIQNNQSEFHSINQWRLFQ